jgi:hypothetical protein
VTRFDGQRVVVYKNLHRGDWSVRAHGRVIGHVREITLVGAQTHVGCAAQRRIAAGAAREVHAWITGTVCDSAALTSPTRLTYRPRERATFYVADTGVAVSSAPIVAFTERGAFIDEQKGFGK